MPSLSEMQVDRTLGKVLVFSSKGGGNRVVGKAIGRVIEEKFGALVQHPDVDKLWPDPFSTLTGGRFDAINFYNYLLKNGQMNTLNAVTAVGKVAMQMRFKGTVEKIKTLIQREKVGLLVSSTPFIGPILLKAAQEKNIPVLIVSADFDNSLYSFNWPDEEKLPPYRYAIPYTCDEILETVNPSVDFEKVVCTGYPLRQEFLKSYSVEEIVEFRKEIGVVPNQKLVLLMLGSCGGASIKRYTKSIIRSFQKREIQQPIYLAVVCGRNQKMPQKISKLAKKQGLSCMSKLEHPDIISSFRTNNSGLTVSTVGFTADVYKFMAVAGQGGLMVTKPGPGSLAEGINMTVPVLVDNVKKQIPWESMNPALVEKYSLGKQVTDYSKVGIQINTLLKPVINDGFKEDIELFKSLSLQRILRPSLDAEAAEESSVELLSPLLERENAMDLSFKLESFNERISQLCLDLISEKEDQDAIGGEMKVSSVEDLKGGQRARSCGFMSCVGR
ncbi:MAG: UDP-N-acetylglucosamine:LPS N-acetylglucosamine transferase [Halioglobus sp.]|jgi:UDP-N-acetylglucosamine:LPS N-acetylglucosamine transferase